MRLLRAAALLLLWAPAWAGPAAETASVLADAKKRWQEGDHAGAASAYDYLLARELGDADVAASLALAHRDAGDPDQAAAFWLKATLMRPDDAFLWNGRGWNYLALGRLREARDSFRKGVEVSSGGATAAEAHFGLGLAESLDGNLENADRSLREANRLGPPSLQAAALAELGRVAVRRRRLPEAATWLAASLAQDPMQEDVARALGAVYEKTGQSGAAWQAYKLALDLDPGDSETAGRKASVEKYIRGRPEDSMPLVRLARPLLRSAEGEPADAGPTLRVALFSGADARPRRLTRFYVMGSTVTRLVDAKLGERIDSLPVFAQWEIVFRPDNRVIEVRDTSSRVVYVTRQPLRFEPATPGHTVLVKNPELDDVRGVDLSDRELRGVVELIPAPSGFHLVNEVRLEPYLYGIIGGLMPRTRAAEAYKTAAVLLRSRVLASVRARPDNPEGTHLCDSEACIPYVGLARERDLATQAVRETAGVVAELPAGETLEYHLSCGGWTRSGAQDRERPVPAPAHPAALERFLHAQPDAGDFSEAAAEAPAVWSRWVRLLDPADLRRAGERQGPLGAPKTARVGRRDPHGRVMDLTVEGVHGSLSAAGEGMAALLSPGSLRSTFFAVQPLYRGKRLERLLLWGAGTGHARGLCVAGALGQAHSGRDHRSILRHYFPSARLVGDAPPKSGTAAGSVRRAPARARSSSRPPPRRRAGRR